ncbi:MAG: Cys-tRNA(Pro)/Cys-tRNA(Cys) deacylase YbaK [Desulfovibrio sp.]
MKAHKTNAARLLDRLKIAYDLIPYAVDESDLSAAHLAATLGEDVAAVFKTLVLKGDKTGHFVCVVPGDTDVDLKKAAKVSGNKNAALIPMKDLIPVTGYMRGGCSPLAMKKKFTTFIHHSVTDHARVYVSAGQRGLQLFLTPADLVAAAEAVVADIVTV